MRAATRTLRSPTPVVAYLSVGSKAAGFAVIGFTDTLNREIGSDVALDHVEQARLKNGNATFVKDADFFRIHIQTQHVITHLCQAGTADQAYIAGTNDGNFQKSLPRESDQILHCAWADRFPNRHRQDSANRTAAP